MVYYVDRYGEAIEYDLHHELGLDLLDFFRGRYSWDKLWRLLQRLPRTAQFHEALAEDEEYARELLEREELAKLEQKKLEEKGWRVSEYSPVVELLTAHGELLVAANAQLTALRGKDAQAPRPWPRVRTALARLREQRSLAATEALIEEAMEAQRRRAELEQESS